MRERLKVLNDELLLAMGRLLLSAIEALIFLLGLIVSQQSVKRVLNQLSTRGEPTGTENEHRDRLEFRLLTRRQLRQLSQHRLYIQLHSAADGTEDGG